MTRRTTPDRPTRVSDGITFLPSGRYQARAKINGRHWVATFATRREAVETRAKMIAARPDQKRARLLADLREIDDGGVALTLHAAALERYLGAQARVTDEMREIGLEEAMDGNHRPWPAQNSPMLHFLLDRAKEIASEEESDGFGWLVLHAFREGYLAAVSDAALAAGGDPIGDITTSVRV